MYICVLCGRDAQANLGAPQEIPPGPPAHPAAPNLPFHVRLLDEPVERLGLLAGALGFGDLVLDAGRLHLFFGSSPVFILPVMCP